MMPLLYDRVSEAFDPSPHFAEERAMFRRAPTYDLTDIFPLFFDWEREMRRRVPRRPPCDMLWTEWRHPVPINPALSPLAQVTTAVWLERTSDKFTSQIRTVKVENLQPEDLGFHNAKPPKAGQDEGRTWAHIYAAIFFHRVETLTKIGAQQCPDLKDAIGVPTIVPTMSFYCLNDDGTEWAHLPQPGEGARWAIGSGLGGMLTCHNDLDASQQSIWSGWPAFMAFALLHCKNIVTEDHKPPSFAQKARQRINKPKLTTYKTLKIEVPKSAQARQYYDGSDNAGPMMRFHLCSGHFRELRSERFTSKRGQWVWVPAHFRGSKDLGEVVTRRVITH